MNPVVGLDVSKGESEVQGFLEKGKPYGKNFSIKHDLEGLGKLLDFLKEIKELTGQQPPVVLESTGHYHKPVVQYLDERHYLLIIVNPLISHKAKSSSLRKVKTDAVDAYRLCELFYKEELEPYKKRGIRLLNLRNLTRQHSNITDMYVQTKLQFQAVLDQVFPEYRGVFGDLYSLVSLIILKEYPSSEDILITSEDVLSTRLKELYKNGSKKWIVEKVQLLKAAAARNPFQKNLYHSHLLSVDMYINMLLQYKEHLSKLEAEIDTLAKDIEEYNIIQSIPGIGEKIAATIISEIGEIDRFDNLKQLVAFAGIDPEVFESGKFKATLVRITKRGSSRLRHALYMAVRSGIRDSRKKKTTDEIIPRNKRLREFYDKKRSEGKLFKVAVIACANKLLQWIFALLKNRTTFQDIA
ncbi:IS110 family transposase [Niallia circulans]|uniref:IS110 family transposase n=1 Tax=Niallia circulans TaxID=1397 RepID=A0A553SRR3_NIACI|nr:IS110 family transposase [Niallia circulans]TRZ39693.1 IS110 family transposase [Niallia circulans]